MVLNRYLNQAVLLLLLLFVSDVGASMELLTEQDFIKY